MWYGHALPIVASMSVEATHEDRLEKVGEALVNALADRDFERFRATMADGVRFRLLLPKGPQAHTGVDEAVEVFVGWYGDVDELHLESSSVGTVGDRLVLTYRFRLHDADGWQVIEQHAVADVAPNGRLEMIDLLCSGFLPVIGPADQSNGTHPFDAGDLGCADGLATEFRRRIGAIPVGDVLVVTARDPAAKEDLPPLARMMGHEVRSIETPSDGRLLMTVERRR
jgi:TusA-related sulfurtransferase